MREDVDTNEQDVSGSFGEFKVAYCQENAK